MDTTKKFFLDLLSAYINNKEIKIQENINWKDIIYLSDIHNVQGVLYLVTHNLNEIPELEYLKKSFLMSVSVSVKQDFYMQKICSEFEKAQIKYMPFKGYIIRNYYYHKEARTFGDIDIVIDEKNRSESDRILKSLNFQLDRNNFMDAVWAYSNNIVYFEIHTHIMYNNLLNGFDYIKYFDSKVKNKIHKKGCCYELRKEDHFIYLIVHMAKHFYSAGVGIRMIMDLVFFKKYFNSELNFDYINSEIRIIKLDEFANVMYNICNFLFETDFKCEQIEKTKLQVVIDYIINHGVFGYENKDVNAIKFNVNLDRKRNLLNNFFPELNYMKEHFIWFKNGKRYQLPYAWVRRLVEQLSVKTKRTVFFDKLKAVFDSNNDDSNYHNKILKLTGLK